MNTKNNEWKIEFWCVFFKNGFIFLKCTVCTDFFSPKNVRIVRIFSQKCTDCTDLFWKCTDFCTIFFKKVLATLYIAEIWYNNLATITQRSLNNLGLILLSFELNNFSFLTDINWYFYWNVCIKWPELPPMAVQYHCHVSPSVSHNKDTALQLVEVLVTWYRRFNKSINLYLLKMKNY